MHQPRRKDMLPPMMPALLPLHAANRIAPKGPLAPVRFVETFDVERSGCHRGGTATLRYSLGAVIDNSA